MRGCSWLILPVILLAGCAPETPAAPAETPVPSATPAPPTASLSPTAGGAASPTSARNPGPAPAEVDASPPAQTIKLIFIHHSSGENWLADENGGLGLALMQNNFFVSDTNYGWGPDDPLPGGPIGDHTDTGDWWNWFLGPSSAGILRALYAESG
jgi:hypothetical protein